MPVETTNDSGVVREVLSGRTEAFRVLVERYFATVRLVALAKTGNAADAEDVAQDTFIKAYETLGVLRDRARLAPWLVAIARNLAISLVRRRERERRNADAIPVDPRVYPDHEKRETLDAVARQVEALPENLREVVLLHYFEGLKCREIGERLDLNTNAVVKRLTRGREVLGDRLLREWGEGGQRRAGGRIQQVMGAIVVLPRPDWEAQLAGMGGAATAKSGGLAAAILGPPVAFKVFTAASAVALVALYVSLNVRGGGDDTSTAAGAMAPAKEKGFVAAAASGVGAVFKSASEEDEDGPVWVAMEPILSQPKAEVGFVSGVVIDVDGAPVRDAVVWAGGNQNTGKGTSNPNGDFRINVSAPETAIKAGEVSKYVQVSCSVPGFVPRVVPDVRLGTADLQLVLVRPAMLAGRVVDAKTGAPVTQFSLRIDRESFTNPETGESTNPYWQATYSATGDFRLEGPYGIGQVEAIAPGYVGVRTDIGLAQGEIYEGMLIALERGGEVRGFVFDAATREPIPKASVRLATPTEQPREDYMVKTRKDGSFIWTELPLDGPVALAAESQGYKVELRTLVASDMGEPEPVNFYLERGGSVRGRVSYNGGPPPGCDAAKITDGYCMVSVRSPEKQAYSHGFARPDGTYEVTGLEDGDYLVNASFRVNRTGAQGESNSKRVTVRDGQATELDINFNEPAGNITLAVTGLEAINGVQLDLHAVGDSFVLSSTFLSPSEPLRAKGPSGAIPESVQQQAYSFPRKIGGFPTLEPGEYVLRFYWPEEGSAAVEERIRVLSGETIEVSIDLAEMGNRAAQEDAREVAVEEPDEADTLR